LVLCHAKSSFDHSGATAIKGFESQKFISGVIDENAVDLISIEAVQGR